MKQSDRTIAIIQSPQMAQYMNAYIAAQITELMLSDEGLSLQKPKTT